MWLNRWLLALVIGLVLALAGVSCGGSGDGAKNVRVALDWFPWSNHSGLFIAQEKGYFKSQNLNVDIYTPADPATVLQTVGAGKDDFGISYQLDVLLARAQGIPVVSIAALVQHPLNSIMTLKESGLTRPRDLKGKKIGYPGLPSDTAMLRTVLTSDGIRLDDVELVNVGFDLVPVLIGKKVDAILGAYWVHESIDAELQGYPVNIMRLEQWGVPDYYELVLVTSEKKVKEDPDLLHRFVHAAVKGYEDAIANPQASVDVLAKAHPEINQEVERRGVELLAPLWKDNLTTFGGQTEARWRGVADWMKANGVLDKAVDPSRAFTDTFIKE